LKAIFSGNELNLCLNYGMIIFQEEGCLKKLFVHE